MTDCLFCKIARGDIPSDKVHEDEDVIVFKDIHPVAPVHALVVPKRHYDTLLEMTADARGEKDVVAAMRAVKVAAAKLGVEKRGFRLINNCGDDGGQTIPHVHFHLIGGKALGEGLV